LGPKSLRAVPNTKLTEVFLLRNILRIHRLRFNSRSRIHFCFSFGIYYESIVCDLIQDREFIFGTEVFACCAKHETTESQIIHHIERWDVHAASMIPAPYLVLSNRPLSKYGI